MAKDFSLKITENQRSICVPPIPAFTIELQPSLKHIYYTQWFPVFIANEESFGKKIFALAIPLLSINPTFHGQHVAGLEGEGRGREGRGSLWGKRRLKGI